MPAHPKLTPRRPPGQVTIISSSGTGFALCLSRPPSNSRTGPKLKPNHRIEPIYITGREKIEGVIEVEEYLNLVTIDSGDETDIRFDYESDKSFDEDINGDIDDNDMDI